MFFILSKLLYFLATPIIWIVVLFIYSRITDKPDRRKISFAVALFGLLFFSNSFLFDEIMRKWEVQTFHRNEIVEPYDYAIVLSGMMSYDPQFDRINFHGGIDRLLQAIELYSEKKVRKIFISGGYGSLIDDSQEAELLKEYFVKLGIPEEDIEYEIESHNTHENAVFTKKYFEEKKINGRYLLITSAYHIRRAVKCFEKEGVKVDTYPANRKSGPRKFVFDHVFIPNASTLTSWNTLLHELIGFVSYKMSGYI